ncbi:type II toxin-antitoxin system ParD family antitoxin [Sphingobium sp. SA916]|uniref:type II toxin-antitoxin system ParD family antitoxin n=1 Tax=Sphingobium sp. SA916 TaxID=1851207 RepID=UPI000C9F9BDA|nr:type II toxin-antitoxin system ParD family antitoxin [Sphingobium sp. SA916]PNQ04024.1 CopG family transcriptional regulator [Sphingobium sp. SA916]
MRSTQQFSVTLPKDLAAWVRAKVASGEYANESEVIRDGLRELQARDPAMENWLRDEALPSYDAYKAAPKRGLSLDEVKAGFAARHKRAAKRD